LHSRGDEDLPCFDVMTSQPIPAERPPLQASPPVAGMSRLDLDREWPGARDAETAVPQAELETCLRDLMSLIALPELRDNSGPREIMEQFCEALGTLLSVQVCVATGPSFVKDASPVSVLRVRGEPVPDQDRHWGPFISKCAEFRGMAPETVTEDSPCGPLRVVKFGIGYRDDPGSLAVGTTRANFPSRTEAAVLRTAVSLAAGRLKTARLAYEREQAMRVKDEFLAMLGHELRNPLAPITTALGLMKLRGDTKTSAEQQIIRRQVDHLTRLVDDLMDVARITRGAVELRTMTVELSTVLMNAIEMATPILEQRSHRLAIDVALHGLEWRGDPTRLAQVVANLLTNAARYTEPGGDIRLAAARDDDAITISVTDNGSGMTAELLPRVFDMFVQGEHRQGGFSGGLGIGLTLVKNLVQLHGGEVVATSEGLGKGSQFVVRLPAPARDIVAAGIRNRPEGVAPSADGAKRILVVDDNVDGADTVALVLRLSGHEVRVAYDPAAALVSCQEHPPDVAVLDIGLPVMDGYELARQMRQLPSMRTAHFIALTGYGRDHDARQSSDAGFAEHLVKPVSPDLLIALVARVALAPPA
jgi:signal transduction histidine kinase